MDQKLPAILVIDDEPAIRDLLCFLLEDVGYRVIVATEGEAALAFLCSNPHSVGLILLDMMMPGMNGWQFLAAQRQRPRVATVPVIVLSADRAIPANGLPPEIPFLEKPFEIQDVLDAVASVVPPPLRAPAVGA